MSVGHQIEVGVVVSSLNSQMSDLRIESQAGRVDGNFSRDLSSTVN